MCTRFVVHRFADMGKPFDYFPMVLKTKLLSVSFTRGKVYMVRLAISSNREYLVRDDSGVMYFSLMSDWREPTRAELVAFKLLQGANRDG